MIGQHHAHTRHIDHAGTFPYQSLRTLSGEQLFGHVEKVELEHVIRSNSASSIDDITLLQFEPINGSLQNLVTDKDKRDKFVRCPTTDALQIIQEKANQRSLHVLAVVCICVCICVCGVCVVCRVSAWDVGVSDLDVDMPHMILRGVFCIIF